ncbi:helix-turn-helix transcriptional regulator [Leptolyngbya sp. FACHB-261]|uniref:helix-turn-helix domain-containing protein n=1 Tax=Leptolyngbya sp. FACHB-261 TaxID=2692806 RepID=UPI001689B82E|nr:helix-turn-helix transcriptional regulator [Leptolyngbya sp. FACHB-261]MBD2099830.1 helix-turn-helix transcriptional regulator [Leptolyngbya sp. FACHB-261]
MASSTQALIRPDLWQQDSSGSVSFRKDFSKDRYIEHFITSTVPESKNLVLFTEKAAWNIIWKLGEEGLDTAKLHLMFAAHAFKQEKPWETEFKLAGSDLIKELGWDNRKDLSKTAKLKKVAHHAWLLGSLAVKITWSEGKRDSGVDYSRMWNIPLITELGQPNLQGLIETPQEVIITVKPGAWIERFLGQEELYQFGWLSQQLLRIDSHNGELALRMAMHLTTDSRTYLSGQYQIRSLLEDVLPKEVLEKARSDRRRSYEIRQRLYNAITQLKQLGWQIEGFEKKSKLDELLDTRITIKLPTPIPRLIANQTESKPRRLPPASAAVALTGNRVKEARKARGWSQAKLANFLGVSQYLVSMIERDERSITPDTESKLRQVLLD